MCSTAFGAANWIVEVPGGHFSTCSLSRSPPEGLGARVGRKGIVRYMNREGVILPREAAFAGIAECVRCWALCRLSTRRGRRGALLHHIRFK